MILPRILHFDLLFSIQCMAFNERCPRSIPCWRETSYQKFFQKVGLADPHTQDPSAAGGPPPSLI